MMDLDEFEIFNVVQCQGMPCNGHNAVSVMKGASVLMQCVCSKCKCKHHLSMTPTQLVKQYERDMNVPDTGRLDANHPATSRAWAFM